MEFKRGQVVEVSSKEEGFLGSYYEAAVLERFYHDRRLYYAVQYKNLVEESDSNLPLVETITANELRPLPPPLPALHRGFPTLCIVDAFDNEGWWVGKITGRNFGSFGHEEYYVFFDYSGEVIAYDVSRLRVHQEFVNGNWVVIN